jgi:hypothetical protein
MQAALQKKQQQQNKQVFQQRVNNGVAIPIRPKKRQPIITIVAGMTGIGKTYTTINEIKSYIKDDPKTGKRGRPFFIFDVNMEEDFKKNFPKTITKKTFNSVKKPECFRILPINENGSFMDDEDQRNMAIWLATNAFNCGLLLEDPDNYFRGRKNTKISKLFTSYRHRGTDVILHHQSLSPIETVEWQNVTLIRLHKTVDSVDVISDRVPNYTILKIAELIVNEQFTLAEDYYREKKIGEMEYKKRRSYFIYIDMRKNKIMGAFSKECFIRNARKFLNMNKRTIIDYVNMNVDDKGNPYYTRKQALEILAEDYYKQFYGGRR